MFIIRLGFLLLGRVKMMMNNKCHCGLNPIALGLALGVFVAVMVILFGLTAEHYAYGKLLLDKVAMYEGTSTDAGAILWAALVLFIHWFIKGVIIGLLYNLFNHGCRCICCKKDDESCKVANK